MALEVLGPDYFLLTLDIELILQLLNPFILHIIALEDPLVLGLQDCERALLCVCDRGPHLLLRGIY